MSTTVLERIAAGDPRAVGDCIDEFGGLVWAIARRMTRSRADAEDAVQEIFVDVWRSAGRFDPAQGTAKVFITTIARFFSEVINNVIFHCADSVVRLVGVY